MSGIAERLEGLKGLEGLAIQTDGWAKLFGAG